MTDAHPPAHPHGALDEVFPDVFLVTGVFPMMPLMRIARNMTVVRRGDELTLINSVRLTPDGERELEKLGAVRNLVRLGAGHGIDDPYYVHRYRPRVFAPKRMRHKVPVDHTLVDGEELPFGARAFVFGAGIGDEAALLLPDAGGVLVTCDAIQHWTHTRGMSLLGKVASHLGGFLKPAVIGPIWLKRITDNDPTRMKPEFDRLLALDFKHMLSGHGSPLRDDAKAVVRASVTRTFG